LAANLDGGTVTLNLYRGATLGCYNCHNGPFNSNMNAGVAPTVSDFATNTLNHLPVSVPLPVTGVGAKLQIISQPAHGAVGLSNSVATYFPNAGFVGTDTFTFAAYDGSKNSNLATGVVAVAQGPFSLSVTAHVPPTYPAEWPVAFAAMASVTNNTATVTYVWDFGDGNGPGSDQFAQHAYAAPGTYAWRVIATMDTARATNQGSILIEAPVALDISSSGDLTTLQWRYTSADAVLEGMEALDAGADWRAVTNAAILNLNTFRVSLPATGERFFRLRRTW
jgi:hypothetical protein